MPIKRKINLKKYIVLTLLNFIIFSMLFRTLSEVKVLFVMLVAVLLNQYMLFAGIDSMIRPIVKGEKPENGWVFFLFVSKILILFLGLIYGVQIIGNRIIIPLLFYVFQIFIFVLSQRK